MSNSKVTLNDIYAVMNRLEDKMDARVSEIEKRVDILEDFRSKLLGMSALVAALTGTLTAWIWKKITGET